MLGLQGIQVLALQGVEVRVLFWAPLLLSAVFADIRSRRNSQ